MPIYGLPNNKIQAHFVINRVNRLIRKNRISRLPFSKLENLPQKIIWLSSLKSKLKKDYAYYLKKLRAIGTKYDYDKSKDVLFAWRTSIFNSPFDYKRKFSKTVFEQYDEVKFEDTTIRVPVKYDEYLTMDFGDYMTLPPVEKRISIHPTAIIDFDNSYIEYTKKRR